MKRTLKIGDIIKIVAKDRKKYPLIDYTVKIIKADMQRESKCL